MFIILISFLQDVHFLVGITFIWYVKTKIDLKKTRTSISNITTTQFIAIRSVRKAYASTLLDFSISTLSKILKQLVHFLPRHPAYIFIGDSCTAGRLYPYGLGLQVKNEIRLAGIEPATRVFCTQLYQLSYSRNFQSKKICSRSLFH